MKLRMVDRICAFEPGRAIQGTKTVSFEEYQLRSALGHGPCLPESLLVEALFQLGNWLIVLDSDFASMGLPVRTRTVDFLRPIGPGQRMDMDIRIRAFRTGCVLFDGQGRVGREIAVRGTGCLARLVDLTDYHDPEDLRVLFSQIYRPTPSASPI